MICEIDSENKPSFYVDDRDHVEILAHWSIKEQCIGVVAAFSYYFGIGKRFYKKAEMRFYFWMPFNDMFVSLVRQFYFADATRKKLFHACLSITNM